MHNSPSWRYDVNFLNSVDGWKTGGIIEGKVPLDTWGMEKRVPKRTKGYRKVGRGVKTRRDK